MWKVIYRILSYILLFPAILFLLLNRKTKESVSSRIWPRVIKKLGHESLWIHSASIGEAMIAKSVIDFLKKWRELSFVVTTNTNYAKKFLESELGEVASIYYAPVDVDLTIKSFMRGQNLKALILIETEIWPNMVWEVKKRGLPVVVVNGRISEKAFPIYKKFSFFMKEVFSSIDLVLAQSEKHAERFVELGVQKGKVDVLGNMKYLKTPEVDYKILDKIPAVTFGSIRLKEIEGIINVIKSLKEKYRHIVFFLAPREIRLVGELEKDIGKVFQVLRYSFLKNHGFDFKNSDVILVDTVGDLLEIYARSLVAFVGGSLAPYGGHNILEPLIVGTPVLFGKYIENFEEIAYEVLSWKCGKMVRNYEELKSEIEKLILDHNLRESMASCGKSLIQKKKEEIEKKLECVLKFIC